MKAGTPNHIKSRRLKRLLNVPQFAVVGVLESLWHLTADCADDGGIGRYSNQEIADFIEWDGDADSLIGALLESGWLDHNDDHRLVVHHWIDHAPEFIKERLRKRFARNAKSLLRSAGDNEARPVGGGQARDIPGQNRTDAGQAAACPVYSNPIPSNPSSSCPDSASLDETTLETNSETPKAPAFTMEDRTVAEWMWEKILAMQPNRKPPKLDAWANTIRLMREQDGRTHQQIRELFARVQRDDFWRKNILSPEKLRAKWDDLSLKLIPSAANPAERPASAYAPAKIPQRKTEARAGA